MSLPLPGQATGYSWIESLDVEAKGLEMERHRQFRPLRDRYGAPRLVVAQLDCIRITCVLRSLAKPLLKVLTTWIAERRHGCWLSIFFASFIFLREISVATSDAYEHGRFNPKYRKLEVSSALFREPRPGSVPCLHGRVTVYTAYRKIPTGGMC